MVGWCYLVKTDARSVGLRKTRRERRRRSRVTTPTPTCSAGHTVQWSAHIGAVDCYAVLWAPI